MGNASRGVSGRGSKALVALTRRIESQGRAIRALQRALREVRKQIEPKNVEAIGFHIERVPDDDWDDEE